MTQMTAGKPVDRGITPATVVLKILLYAAMIAVFLK